MTHRAIASSLLLLGLCAAACSLLTNPEQGDIRCKVSDEAPRIDPCPEGMYCVNGACKPQPECKRDENGKSKSVELCEDRVDNDCDDRVDERDDSIPEPCDYIDNDCDGETDEKHDADRDGWTTCGEATFEAGTYDCDPNDKSVNPDAPEICDGQDNDCDGNSDNAPPGKELCESSMLCLRGVCTKPTCAVPEANKPCGPGEECLEEKCVVRACQPACKASEFCDQQQAVPTCVPIPKRELGEGCSTDGECAANLICIGRDALRLPTGTARGVCGKACCKDADCTGPDETCFASGSGTRSCLPRKVAVNTSSGTTKPAVCSVSEDCGSGQACAPATLGSSAGTTLATTVCRTPSMNDRKYAETCGAMYGVAGSATCASRMCVAGNYFQELCSTPCRSSKDCTALREAARSLLSIMQDPPAYCQYAELVTFNPLHGRNYAPVCMISRGGETGSKTAGAECRENRECADGVCIGASSEGNGRCASVCCNDTQCTQIRPELRCRPVIRGTGRYEMRCLQ